MHYESNFSSKMNYILVVTDTARETERVYNPHPITSNSLQLTLLLVTPPILLGGRAAFLTEPPSLDCRYRGV